MVDFANLTDLANAVAATKARPDFVRERRLTELLVPGLQEFVTMFICGELWASEPSSRPSTATRLIAHSQHGKTM
jgi:hypothetical protein